MKRRSNTEWCALFTEQAASGMTATAFCQERGLNPAYFSLRRKQWLNEEAQSAASAFVPVARAPQPAGALIVLQLGGVLVLHVPASVSPAWLAELLQHLRA